MALRHVAAVWQTHAVPVLVFSQGSPMKMPVKRFISIGPPALADSAKRGFLEIP